MAAAFDSAFLATNRRADAKDPHRRGLEGLRTLCCEILPLDEERSLESKVVLVFWAQAVSSSEKRADNRRKYDRWREEILARLEEAREDGDVDADLDLLAIAEQLITLLNGFQVSGALMPEFLQPPMQLTIIEGFLRRLQSGR